MAFGFAGAATGAAQSLEEIVAARLMKQQMQQAVEERTKRFTLDQQRADEAAEQNKFNRERTERIDKENRDARTAQIDSDATKSRGRSNMAGVLSMGLDPQTAKREIAYSSLQSGANVPSGVMESLEPAPTPKKYSVRTVDGNGRPINKLATEAEMEAGVPEYREPKTAPQPHYERVVVDGKETFLTPEEVRARGGVTAASRKRAATGAERQTLGFYNRMDSALKDMDAVEDQLTEKDLVVINNSPLPDLINNHLLSGPGQKYAQALRTYTEARLRKESGAAIQNFEYDADRKAISRQSGDLPESLSQKRSTRTLTAKGIGYASGPAYEEFYGEAFNPDSEVVQKKIPGVEGGIAESRDGGKTWTRVK